MNYFLFIQENILLFAVWFLLFSMLIVSFLKKYLSKALSLSVPDFISVYNNEDSLIVDLRVADSFNSNHIAGSYNINFDKYFLDKTQDLIKNKDTKVLLVCDSGGDLSNSAAKLLHKSGYGCIYKLEGGISNWLYYNLPTTLS